MRYVFFCLSKAGCWSERRRKKAWEMVGMEVGALPLLRLLGILSVKMVWSIEYNYQL